MAFTLIRAPLLSLDGFAARGRLHPHLVRRFVALGLLHADRDAAGRYWLAPTELVTMARIQRLHEGLALNYAAIGVVLDLLARIDELEATQEGRNQWTPTN